MRGIVAYLIDSQDRIISVPTCACLQLVYEIEQRTWCQIALIRRTNRLSKRRRRRAQTQWPSFDKILRAEKVCNVRSRQGIDDMFPFIHKHDALKCGSEGGGNYLPPSQDYTASTSSLILPRRGSRSIPCIYPPKKEIPKMYVRAQRTSQPRQEWYSMSRW